MIYRTKWVKRPISSFFQYLRDYLIFYLPIPYLPYFVLRTLYGVIPKFVFLVHPRRSEDIFIALPFLSILRKFLPKTKAVKLIKKIPPFVIATIKSPTGLEGVVISSLYLPKFLIKSRRKTLREYFRTIKFVGKITHGKTYMGLGAWWPIVTRR
ncbi:MAG: hypothetical protein WBC99_03200, partial [Candidatus Omnitrophota bacterium]